MTTSTAAAEPVVAPLAPDGPTIPHQPALDGLRGLAVAGVLLFHGGHLTGGYLGVDAFFVLSGFLITTLLLVERGDRGRISLGHFWARRARRLLPALALVLLAVAAYAAFAAQPGDLATIRGDAFSTLLYYANWHSIGGGDYFAIFASPSPLQHTWSLAIEEQFYLVWPVLLVLLLGRSVRSKPAAAKRVLVLSVVLLVASVSASQLLYRSADPSRVYYGTDTRASAVLIGAILASLLVAWGSIEGRAARRLLEAAAVAALLGLAWAWTSLSGSSVFLYRGGLLLCGLAAAVVIAAGVHPSRGPVAAMMAWRPLTALGLISYGVYLWHWPVFVWLSADRTGLSGWVLFTLQCAVTILVSIVSYKLVERPIRHGWGTRRAMLVATPLTAAVLVVALVVATPTSGLPVVPFPTWIPGAHNVPRADDDSWKLAVSYLQRERAKSEHVTRMLVFGDSVVLTLGGEVEGGVYRGKGVAGVALGFLRCSLLPGDRIQGSKKKKALEQDPNCDEWPKLLGDAIDAYQPAVVAAMLGPNEMLDRQENGKRENAGSQRLTDDLTRQLERASEIVTKSGARFVILTTPCFRPPKATTSAQEVWDVWRDQTRVAWLNRVWRQFVTEHPAVSLANFGALLCPQGRPIETRVGYRYRSDGVHFTRAGALLAWRWIDAHVLHPVERAP